MTNVLVFPHCLSLSLTKHTLWSFTQIFPHLSPCVAAFIFPYNTFFHPKIKSFSLLRKHQTALCNLATLAVFVVMHWPPQSQFLEAHRAFLVQRSPRIMVIDMDISPSTLPSCISFLVLGSSPGRHYSLPDPPCDSCSEYLEGHLHSYKLPSHIYSPLSSRCAPFKHLPPAVPRPLHFISPSLT